MNAAERPLSQQAGASAGPCSVLCTIALTAPAACRSVCRPDTVHLMVSLSVLQQLCKQPQLMVSSPPHATACSTPCIHICTAGSGHSRTAQLGANFLFGQMNLSWFLHGIMTFIGAVPASPACSQVLMVVVHCNFSMLVWSCTSLQVSAQKECKPCSCIRHCM